MKNKSIWEQKNKNLKSLKRNMQVDVLIIGGGITGLSCLYNLRNSNLKTILVERNTCGSGISMRSTAKITFAEEPLMINIRKYLGNKKALKYLESQISAMHTLKETIINEEIDCDLKEVDSYVFTCDEDSLKTLDSAYNFYKNAGLAAEYVDFSTNFVSVKKSFKVPNTYTFNPVKYLNHLKELLNKNIYENTKVESIIKKNDFYLCKTKDFSIKAKHVIIASHYPYFLKPFFLPFKSYIETSFIGARKVPEYLNISAINIDKNTHSFRYYNDNINNYLIYLNNSTVSANIKKINNYFKNLETKGDFDYLWSNNDIISNDYLPYIGNISKSKNKLLIGTGYNTWGFTNGTLAGLILSDIILKKENPYQKLFSPRRSLNLAKIVRLPKDLVYNIKAFIKSHKKNVNNKKVIYKKIRGINVAIYTDEAGIEHTVINKCPHLKCGLVFNELEKTWDCMCHGSRFDIDGKCLEGPSNYDITFKL